MKKLLKDCCTKNALTFKKVIYEQIDSVSIRSCLGPVLANIFMAELETFRRIFNKILYSLHG